MEKPATVDQYIAQQEPEVAQRLQSIRQLIFELFPEVFEKIGYGMPSYKLYGRQFLYYAAFKNHIGFYGYPQMYIRFKEDLKFYKTGKGSVQFPLKEPLPLNLLKEMILFRASEMPKK